MLARVLALVWVASAAAGAQPAPDPASAPDTSSVVADSARADSVRADSARVDSLAEAQVDSAAVAALADTTSLSFDVLGEGAAVELFGRSLFEVWGGLGDLSPQQRAVFLSERLEELARSRDIDPAALRAVRGSALTTLQLEDVIVMSVTDQDAQALGVSRADAAQLYRRMIVDGVTRYRDQATLRGVARGAGITAVLLVLLVLGLRALGLLFAWFDRRSAPLRARLVRPIRIGTLEVIGRDRVARLGRGLMGLARLAASLVLVYVFLTTAFGLFPWTQSWSDGLLDAALTPLRQIGAALAASIDNVIALAIIVAVIRWAMRFSDYLFAQVARGEVEVPGFHSDLADPTRKIAKFLLVIMGLMLAYPYTPIADNRGFQGLTVFFGLLLSIGSSTAISNMVAGVVLTYTRAFRLGDRVKVGDTFGDVVEKTFLVTRIRTPKNEDISVPNATVLSNHIVNYSVMAREGSGVVLHTEVTIGYDVPWPQVHGLLTQAAHDTECILDDPAPFVLQTALGDFSVAYQLNGYTKEVTRMARIYSDLHQHIQDRFAEAGVEVLSPTYHARRDGPSTVPDVAAVRDASARAQAASQPGETDGADIVSAEPELPPDVEPPAFIGGPHGG